LRSARLSVGNIDASVGPVVSVAVEVVIDPGLGGANANPASPPYQYVRVPSMEGIADDPKAADKAG
jgi:hypothetical protein